MTLRFLSQLAAFSFAAASAAVVCAAPIVLLEPGVPDTPEPATYANFQVAPPLAMISSAFSAGSVTGYLDTYVFADVAENPFAGGLTFVYELKNISSADSTHGVSFFDIAGWAGFDIWGAFGDTVISSTSAVAPVRPGQIERDETGDLIRFTFPPGSQEPPIFAGEEGMQLILFTNATAYAPIEASVVTNDFFEGAIVRGTREFLSVNTLTGSTASTAVADGGAIAVALGAAMVALALFGLRLPRRAV